MAVRNVLQNVSESLNVGEPPRLSSVSMYTQQELVKAFAPANKKDPDKLVD